MANRALNAIITIGGAISGSLGGAIGSARRRMRQLGDTTRQLEREQDRLGRSIRQAMQQGRPVNDLIRQYRDLERRIAAARNEQDRMNRAVRQLESGRALRASGAGTMQSAATTGAMAAIPIIGTAKRAMEYDYQLQMIGNTADMTAAQIAQLDARIEQVSKDTNQSAENTQRAFGFLIAAGMEVEQASASLGTVGKSATAAGADVEDMAKSAFTLGDALKINPAGLEKALDALSVAGKMGNFELRDMAQQLPVLGSSFSALKMEGLEAASTIGAALQIARKGAADPSEAANNLKNYMAKLQSPETLKKAQKFGLNLNKVIVDAQKKGQNPFEAATFALYKTIGNDQKKMGEIFADMQVQNFLRPMFQNLERYKEIKRAALDGDGTVDRDFVKVMSTTKEQVDKIGGALGRMAIAFGQAITMSMGGGGDLAANIDAVTTWIKANKELVGTVVKVGASMLAMRFAVGAVVYMFGTAKTLWATTKLALNGIKAAGPLAGKALGFVGTALRFVGKSFLIVGRALLTNPIGLAITAIAIGAYLIWKNWEPISAFFVKLWGDIKDATATAWNWLSENVLNFSPLGLVISNWEPVKAFFTGLFDDIVATARQALDWVIQKIAAVGDMWKSTKSFFGFGDDAPQPQTSAPAPRMPPPVPSMATGKGGRVLNDQSTHHWNITQKPGEDSQALARRMAEQMRIDQRMRAGSLLYDKPRGY